MRQKSKDYVRQASANATLKDLAYQTLHKLVLDTNIYSEVSDQKLDERKLAEKFGISRTPIREALARLAQEGLVEIIPRKGVWIRRKSVSQILEMVITWSALESMAARLATQYATDGELEDLRQFAENHSEEVKRNNIEKYSQANISFHKRILQLSKCSLLAMSADQLFQHMYAIRKRAMGEANRAERSVVEHEAIVAALEIRDPDLAERLVREHTMRLHDHIRDTWQDALEELKSNKTGTKNESA
ncbi:MAG: GntR family transcriptional regulator [Pseudomonadota bacterium]